MTVTEERAINPEAVRTVPIRDNYGDLRSLGRSIVTDGMRRPVVLWRDGTLISGGRRHRAHLLLAQKYIPAVFVDSVEDAAKCLLGDNEDGGQALPLKMTEVCRIWELLRRLDAPAAALRADEARRRGVELRRQTQSGKRKPGRSVAATEDFVLSTVAPPFGMSYTTAKRLWTIYAAATGITNVPDEKSEQARKAMAAIDAGESSIWANYQRLIDGRSVPTTPRPAEAVEPVSAARQLAAWSRSLPQMEGLVAGLTELGSPNAALTWEQIGPVYDRLAAIRRDLEKMIKKMRESNQS